MAWIRFDDQFMLDRRVWQINNTDLAVWICSVTHATHLKADGILNHEAVRLVLALRHAPKSTIEHLITAGLWERMEDGNIRLVPGRKPIFGLEPIPEKEPILRRRWRRIRPTIAPEVFAQDGHRCKYCGTGERLTVDHIIPFRRGGTNDRSNLQTLCVSCNARKRDA